MQLPRKLQQNDDKTLHEQDNEHNIAAIHSAWLFLVSTVPKKQALRHEKSEKSEQDARLKMLA